MGSISFILSGDEAKVVEALRRMDDEQRKVVGGLQQSGRAGKEAGEAISGAFDGGTQQALNLVSALTGIGSATAGVLAGVRLLKEEWAAVTEREKEAAAAGLALGTSQAALAQYVLPPGTDLPGLLAAASAKSGYSELALSNMAPGILGAAGGRSSAQIAEALATAAQLAGPGGLGPTAGSLVGGALRLQDATGGTLQQSLGLERIGAQELGFTDPGQAALALAQLQQVSRSAGEGPKAGIHIARYLRSFQVPVEQAPVMAERVIEMVHGKGLPSRSGRGIEYDPVAPGRDAMEALAEWAKTAPPEMIEMVAEAGAGPRNWTGRAALRGYMTATPDATAKWQAAGVGIPIPGSPETQAAFDAWTMGGAGGPHETLRRTEMDSRRRDRAREGRRHVSRDAGRPCA